MRIALVLVAVLLSACGPAPVAPAKPVSAEESWYDDTVQQLNQLNREAENLLRAGKSDATAALITKGQPMMTRLLSVQRPTLAAMEAASDLDELYGRMLLSNRHYGWARLLFQKNLARWTNWRPQTAETGRRRESAKSQIAECDREMVK
ncbi:MAG: hypothetical protein ABJF23_09590 [Bryobacteraceae bacterium]